MPRTKGQAALPDHRTPRRSPLQWLAAAQGTTAQLAWAAVAVGVGLCIGLALHRIVGHIPAATAPLRVHDVTGGLLAAVLAMVAGPWGQATLAQRGLWLATLAWPLAILVGFVVVLGLP